jgi:hypothetical protein
MVDRPVGIAVPDIFNARTVRCWSVRFSSKFNVICHPGEMTLPACGGFWDIEQKLIPARSGALMFAVPCSIEGVVDRGVRMTEQGAAPDNVAALERREAQGSRAEGPRASGPPPPQVTWVPESWRDTGRSQGR